MRTRALLLLCLAACTGTDPKPSADDTGDTGVDTDVGTDTDTSDTDTGDPILEDCEVELPAAATVEADPACAAGGADPDPFEVEARWPRIIDPPAGHTPVLGHVDDDNGDGVIGSGDKPEIASVSHYGTGFAVLDTDGGEVWRVNWGYDEEFHPIFADLDGDGAAELVMGDYVGARLVAVDGATGAVEWTTESLSFDCRWSTCLMTAADLDGDGAAEVISDRNVVDGATGALELTLALPDTGVMALRAPLAADLDLDGTLEIVVGDTAYAADGEQLWTFGGEARSAYPAPVQLDADPEAELAISLDYDLLLVDTDGTVLATTPVPGAERFGWAGLPCVGDLDGDGESEVVVPGGEQLSAFERDGSVAWSARMWGNDGTGWYSGATGCAVFDFDRDGDVEVVLGDAAGLRIHDGRDGSTLWETADYGAYMGLQGPVIADVDADGSAEIVAASTGHILNGSDWQGIQIYEHPRGAWRTEGTVWGVDGYAVGNQTATGGFSTTPSATWNEPGLYRGQLAVAASDEALPALVVEIADACEACDADAAHLSVVVGNVGAARADDAAVELRAVAADGAARVLARAALDPIAVGTTHAGVDLEWAPSSVASGERLVVAATHAGDACGVEGAVTTVEAACE